MTLGDALILFGTIAVPLFTLAMCADTVSKRLEEILYELRLLRKTIDPAR